MDIDPTIQQQSGGTGTWTFSSRSTVGAYVVFRFAWTGTLQPTGSDTTPHLRFTMQRTTAAKDSLVDLVYTATATSPTANSATNNHTGTF